MAKYAEGVVDDVLAYFQGAISDKLEVINIEYNDGVVLEEPKKWAISEDDLDQLSEWPCLLIMIPHVNIDQYNAQSVENVYDLTIGCLIIDADIAKLKRKLYRYGRVIFELLVEGAKSGMGYFPVSDFAMDFQPIYAHQDSFVSDAQVTVKISSRRLERI